MTTHVVCLDGTNQVKVQTNPTNIARIFDTLGGGSADAGNGSFEVAAAGLTGKYRPGVGTQGDPVLKLLGNAFGDGIAEPILRGYTFLSRNYAPGDEIIITGFSRGATAARALAGLTVVHGLLDSTRYDPGDKTTAYLRAIAAWYAYREPNGNFVDQARLALIGGTLGQPVPKLVAADYTPPPIIRAVGVFDTVSSLGLPQFTSSGSAAFDFSICDTVLNPNIQHGFHALAADETRDLFSPTFWTTRAGIVQQVFPGCHSDVGGGYPNRGLSDGALDWMLTQFQAVGLACDRALLNPPLGANPLDVAQDDGATFPFVLTPRSARAFPESAAASTPLNHRRGQLTEMLPTLSPAPYKPAGAYADGRPL
jgi:glutathione S-transferase